MRVQRRDLQASITRARTHAHARAHVLSAHTKKRCMPLLSLSRARSLARALSRARSLVRVLSLAR
eukprot:COSAG06_NODE_2218_length_7324_cov_2.473633_6_plen_64_part_01